jgi:hypothetical protein
MQFEQLGFGVRDAILKVQYSDYTIVFSLLSQRRDIQRGN